MPRNADRPGKLAGRERLAERRAHPITGIRQNAAKAYTGRDDTIDLRQSQSPASSVPFDIRPEHPLASAEPDRSSNSRAGTAATPA